MQRNSTLLLIAGTCIASLPLALSAAREPEPKQPTPAAPTLTPAAAPAAAAPTPTPAAAAEPADPADALIGKAPPPIKVAKWVKGEPLTGFEKGKVYVVDFWATWCGPCNAAIPHLTKLAQEHKGKVEVVGISISERQKDSSDTAYFDTVDAFVKKKGDRMDYRVAVDTPDKQMHTTWFKPSGTGGIPTAWIIDQNGLVAWIGIGSPSDVERIVNQVLAGTFDIKKAELKKAAEGEAKRRSEADIAAAKEAGSKSGDLYAKYPGYQEAMKRGDQSAALASLNAAFKADPASEATGAYQWKIMILMQRNKVEEVNQYARELMDKFPTNGDVIGFVSAVIVSTREEAKFDKQIALESAKKSLELSTPDSRWAQYAKYRLAWAYFHAGDRAKAVENANAALEGVRKLKGKFDFNDLDTECEDAIKEFQKPATK